MGQDSRNDGKKVKKVEREVAVGAAAVSTFKIGRKFVERSLRILSYTTVLSNWLITEIIDPVLRMKYAYVGGRI
ncbi:hypothetical protein AAEY33_10350 [Peribacillus simplex]|jgi:hypothetical protein|uniref:hypothetical protein n=1 Tax=Peribacillus simplex TaxID=1478 RepID=UPI0032677B1C